MQEFDRKCCINNNGKPQFLRDLASWIEMSDELKFTNTENIILYAQTSSEMKRTLWCQAALIEDLLTDDFDFVLTASLQSDPPERRYSRCRHMSGGLFLVSAKDVMYSENF